jgi:hypothetical protein
VHRILARHNLNRLPANQKHRSHAKRWQRYEKPQPGHRLQIDVKFLERIPGARTLYQFTAIDDCTRIRVLKVYDRCNQGTAIRFLDEVRHRLPFRVHVVQADNGAEFQSHFHWRLEALDIRRAISTDILHFLARVLVIHAARDCQRAATLIPDTVRPISRAVPGSPDFASRRTGPRRPCGRKDSQHLLVTQPRRLTSISRTTPIG